jgi:nitroreductase
MDLASVDKVLTTTRTVRKRLDLTRPVEPAIIQECLEIAVQAPAGGGIARYHFVVVTDPAKRVQLADIFRRARAERRRAESDLLGARPPRPRMSESVAYLHEHLHEVPIHILPCVEYEERQTESITYSSLYGNILPATWSLMLALRARGIGAAWTNIHLVCEEDAAALLGIPANIRQVGLLPVAYFLGDDFKPAKRVPARERTYWDGWGQTR